METHTVADDAPEIAIGSIERATLSALLTAVHRGGYGHVTRVIDPERGDEIGQLRRAGVTVPDGFRVADTGNVAVMISAAARTPAAVELLRRYGATDIWTAARATAPATLLLGAMSSRRTKSPAAEPTAD
jgi:hypothetical protein